MVLLAQIPFRVGDYGVATKGEGEGEGQWAGPSSGTQGSDQVVAGAKRSQLPAARPGGASRPRLWQKDSTEQGLRGHRAGVCLY